MEDKDFLSYFDKLSNEQDKIKLQNAERIVSTLTALSHAPGENRPVVKSRFGDAISEDLDYTLDRLLKGAAGESMHTKVGFSLPFIELLKKFKDVDTKKVYSAVLSTTNQKNAVTKGERSHFQIARVLELHSLILSGRLDQKGADIQLYQPVYEQIILSFVEFPWSAQSCLLCIQESFRHGAPEKLKEKLKLVSGLVKKQPALNDLKDPAVCTLHVMLGHEMLNIKDLDSMSYVSRVDGFLTSNEIRGLFNKLTACYPEKHLAVKYIATYMVSHKKQQEQLAFWKSFCEYVEEVMSHKEHNYKLFYYILRFFKSYIKQENFPAPLVQSLYQKSIFKLWIRNLTVMNKITKGVAISIEKHLATKLPQVIEQSPNLTAIKFAKVIKEGTNFKFTTASPLAKVLYIAMDEAERDEYIEFLISHYNESKNLNSFVFYLNEIYIFFELVVSVLTEGQVKTIAGFFFKIAGNAPASDEQAPQNDDIEEETNEEKKKQKEDKKTEKITSMEAQNKLQGLILKLLKLPFPLLSKKKNPIWFGLDDNLELWSTKLLKILIQTIGASEEKPDYLQTMKRALKKIKENQETVTQLWSESKEDEEGNKRNKLKKMIGLNVMLTCACLQIQQHQDVVENIEEFLVVFDQIVATYVNNADKQKKNKKVHKENGQSAKAQNDDEPVLIQVFVDLMIALLTRASGYLREAINRAFAAFVENVDSECISNVVSVIERRDEEYLADMEGQNNENPLDLDAEEGDEAEEDGEEMDDEEEGDNNEDEEDDE